MGPALRAVNGEDLDGWPALFPDSNVRARPRLRSRGTEATVQAAPSAAASPDRRSELDYDRTEEVDRFLAEAEGERRRLRDELESTLGQREAIRESASIRETDEQAQVASVLREFERAMAELEMAHADVLAAVQAAAQREANRVVAAARREVLTMRELTVMLAPLVTSDDALYKLTDRAPSAPAPYATRDRADAG